MLSFVVSKNLYKHYLITGSYYAPPRPITMTLAQTNEETEIYSDSLISDVDAEIALEISLRKRLVDTLESRIAWAMALKEILQQQGVHIA